MVNVTYDPNCESRRCYLPVSVSDPCPDSSKLYTVSHPLQWPQYWWRLLPRRHRLGSCLHCPRVAHDSWYVPCCQFPSPPPQHRTLTHLYSHTHSGVGFFYSGLLRRKNALSMIGLSVMCLAVVSFQVSFAVLAGVAAWVAVGGGGSGACFVAAPAVPRFRLFLNHPSLHASSSYSPFMLFLRLPSMH